MNQSKQSGLAPYHFLYRSLFRTHVDGELLEDIHSAVNKGLALGSERFKDEIENFMGGESGLQR